MKTDIAIPVLTGKDADKFEKQIKENETKVVSKEEYERAKKAFDSIKVIL